MKRVAKYIPQERLEEFERKVWHAIFGDRDNPDGYDVIEDSLIFGSGRVSRQMTKSDNVFYFDVPFIVGWLPDGTADVRMWKYLEQSPKTGSRWGKLAAQGFKIMWRINIERTPNDFEIRYSNVPDPRTKRPEGRVDLKTEKIQQMVKETPVGTGRVLK